MKNEDKNAPLTSPENIQPAQESALSSDLPKPAKLKIEISRIILVVISIFSLMGMIILYCQNQILQQKLSEIDTQNIKPTILPTSPTLTISPQPTDSMINWKSYVNNKFNFTFKYPEKMQGAAPPQITEQPTYVLLFVPNTEGELLRIDFIPDEDIETQYKKDKILVSNLSPLEEITFKGYKAYKATFPAMSFQAEFIYIKRGEYLFKIESADTGIPQQILSTLEFL